MKNYSNRVSSFFLLILSILFIYTTRVYSQTLELVPNQPGSILWDYNTTVDDLIFTSYESTPPNTNFHSFNGDAFELVNLSRQYLAFRYLSKFNNKHYFTHFENLATLIEIDGATATELNFPIDCTNPVFIENFNNKMYIVGQDLSGDIIFSYDGNEILAFPAPNEKLIFEIYFSETQNIAFLRLTDFNIIEYSLVSFDGATYTEIPNPSNMELFEFNGEIEDEVIISFYDLNTLEASLFTYNGIDLETIPNPLDTFFYESLGRNEQELFYSYENATTGDIGLYGYSNGSLNPILVSENLILSDNLGRFDDKDYFSVYNTSSSLSEMYSYDGNTASLIEGPTDKSVALFAGSLNDKQYIAYMDSNFELSLAEHISGTTEAIAIQNIPVGYQFYNILHQTEDLILYTFLNDLDEKTLVLYNGSNFILIDNPENFIFNNYIFTVEDDFFLQYYSASESLLFKTNGILATEDFEANPEGLITVAPNPSNEFFTVYMTDLEMVSTMGIKLFTTSGLLVTNKTYASTDFQKEQKITISTQDLASGIYILEATLLDTKVYKKVVVN